MRALIATTALQLGSALVTLRSKEDHLLEHDFGASQQNSQKDHLLLEQYLGLTEPASGSVRNIATMLKSSREMPHVTTLDSSAHCEDAPEGSMCFKAVMYLKANGFRRHPAWYPEYSAESLFQDVQAMLNATSKSDCPMPCAIRLGQRKDMTAHEETMKEEGDGALAKMAQKSKVMSKIESKRAAQDEMAAEIEEEMLQAMANAKAKLEAPTTANVKEEREDGVHAKLAQRFKVTKKTEGKTAAHVETDADVEAEMLQAMADSKGIEAEMLQAMADPKSWPEVSTREDGVHAKMAQTSKVMNIQSKPVAEDEAAEIEAEMLQAMAEAKQGPRA